MSFSLRHYISVAYCFARLAIQRQIEYPLFLVSWLLINPIHYLGGIWLLRIIVYRFQPLSGWGFPELAFLYGLGLLSHGLQVVLFIQTWLIGHMVIRGEFDRILLRPMNVFFLFIVRYINFIGLTDLIPGTIVFLYGCKLVGFVWTMENILKLIMVLAGAVLIRAAIYLSLGSISFWRNNRDAMVGFTVETLERTTIYPLSIYPYLFQMFLTFLVPIGFISFYPAADFLNKETGNFISMNFALLTLPVGIFVFGLGYLIFREGLKRYESVGN